MKEYIHDLENQLATVKSNISEIDDIMKPYLEKKNMLRVLKNEISEKLDFINVEIILQSSRENQAEYLINSANSGSTTFKAWQKFIGQTSLSSSFYNADTGQYYLGIAMHQDKSNLDATHNDLVFFLPMLKSDDDGLIKFTIMEETLSKNDTYWLVYDTNTLMWVFTTGHRLKYNQAPITEHKDLKTVLSFICVTAYYIPIDED